MNLHSSSKKSSTLSKCPFSNFTKIVKNVKEYKELLIVIFNSILMKVIKQRGNYGSLININTFDIYVQYWKREIQLREQQLKYDRMDYSLSQDDDKLTRLDIKIKLMSSFLYQIIDTNDFLNKMHYDLVKLESDFKAATECSDVKLIICEKVSEIGRVIEKEFLFKKDGLIPLYQCIA
jgi:hypothetical protein